MIKALDTWVSLNTAITTANEAACAKLMALEMQGRRRKMFLLRIHSRMNKLRAHRERKALIAGLRKGK